MISILRKGLAQVLCYSWSVKNASGWLETGNKVDRWSVWGVFRPSHLGLDLESAPLNLRENKQTKKPDYVCMYVWIHVYEKHGQALKDESIKAFYKTN